jgi:hypothetical protein
MEPTAINAAPVRDARVRLPREPYPGLRPFLDFEAALLFGRERQVREVIERLKATQFVAVLGGSGSGKSSLIHAGVVPELRSFGIPGAGDLWLPMTCTPGTNVGAADRAARRHSPITRLARRFAALLNSRGSTQADEQRVHDIAEVFRQEAGFARLLEVFGSELAIPPGPDRAEARVLFVLDQFEEVFHPTNQGVADARLLVERVLDHFFQPHPQGHVVITMRSEHLNDCAAFLELPDAINKSSYLIRRLDSDELRDAIVGPAQRFLRLVARSEPDDQMALHRLPAEVVFEPSVLQRLLHDVQAITHDPDHLPLLQHLLARLWEAALQREEMDVPVPHRITDIDLVRAVMGGAMAGALGTGLPTGTAAVSVAAHSGDETALPAELNTLRACVNHWPESVYQWQSPDNRVQLDALFRQLAFKDPNTGLYSQQRVVVDEAALLLGEGKTRADLRTLLAEGFLGSVDYLFWDDEDPERVTLKVSHESFIRGWARFRALIDSESVQFDEYLGVLRKCADWVGNGCSEDFLLEIGEMRRLSASGFVQRLHQADKRRAWARFLGLDRDAVHLATAAPQLDRFVAASEQRLADRRLRQTRARRSGLALLALTVLFALLPTALFSVLVQGPTMRRAELLFDAGNRANRALLSSSQAAVGEAAGTLDSMLRAAALVEQARSGEGPWRLALSRTVLQAFDGWPLFSDQRDFLDHVFLQAEPPVNGTLRQLLNGGLWRTAALPDAATAPVASAMALPASGAAPAASAYLRAPVLIHDVTCGLTGQEGGDAEAPRGELFVLRRQSADDRRAQRALFVPQRPAFDRSLEVFSASVDPQNDACTLGTLVLSTPETLDSRVVFDAGLRFFYYTVEGRATSAPAVIVQEMDWERGSDGKVQAWLRQTLATLTDPAAVAAVRAAAGPQRAAVVPTWRVNGGRAVDVNGRRWRLVTTQAQRVDLPPGSDAPQPLRPALPGTPCARLAATFPATPGFEIDVFEHGQQCFRIARGWPVALPGEDNTRPLRDEVRVAVHERPSEDVLARALESPPAPVAGLVPFARVEPGDATPEPGRWSVGVSGPLQGWLLMRDVDSRGATRHIGLPWSTCALWRLGRELQALNPAPGPDPAAPTPQPSACSGPV